MAPVNRAEEWLNLGVLRSDRMCVMVVWKEKEVMIWLSCIASSKSKSELSKCGNSLSLSSDGWFTLASSTQVLLQRTHLPFDCLPLYAFTFTMLQPPRTPGVDLDHAMLMITRKSLTSQ